MAISPPLPRGQALKSLHRSDFAFGTARSPTEAEGKQEPELQTVSLPLVGNYILYTPMRKPI
jgi:hypothetical protein